jgi:Domain of unknown function (DUF4845)
MRTASKPSNPAWRQNGFSILGLLFWAIVIAYLGYVAVQVVPTVNEYMTIQRLVNKAAETPATSASETRVAFDRLREVEYTAKSVQGKDLEISKEAGRTVVAFSYEKLVPLGGPAFLLLKYQGRSK